MTNEPQTKIRPWAGWQSEANDAIGDAQHAIHQQQPDIAINCLERALNILRAENFRTDREMCRPHYRRNRNEDPRILDFIFEIKTSDAVDTAKRDISDLET